MVSKKQKRASTSVKRNDFSEKFIVFMFLVFATLVVVIFFQGSDQNNLMGKVISGLQLEKNEYNASETIRGTVTLTLDSQDTIPANATLTFAILTNASKCQLNYACQNGLSKPWHVVNNITGECEISKQDPEGDCCMQDTNCSQIILNHDFNAGVVRWNKNTGNGIGAEEIPWMESEENWITSTVAFETGESLNINFSQQLSQIFTGRMPSVTNDLIMRRSSLFGTPGDSQPVYLIEYDSLNGTFAWGEFYGEGTCAFEIVLRSNTSKGLHYYYKLNDACVSTYKPDGTEAYINKTAPAGSEIETGLITWENFHFNIYKDWTTAFNPSVDDYISDIQFISHTLWIGGSRNTQKLIIDNVTLTTEQGAEANLTLSCTNNKNCCLEGTGYGNYYGGQISCKNEEECWQYCANSSKTKLSVFITKTGLKKNQTAEEECQAIVDGNIIKLIDRCELSGVGKGYTAAYSTNGTVVSYKLNLSDSTIKVKAPSKNGTYILLWRFEYLPITPGNQCGEEYNESCIIFQKAAKFTVGIPLTPCQANFTNCGNWSECVNNSRSQVCEDMNSCPENAPTYLKEFLQQGCGCTPNAFQCSGSIYQQCSPDGATWNTITDCGVSGQYCDVSQGCYTPCTPFCEGVECNGSDGCGGTCTLNCGSGGGLDLGSLFKKWYFWVIVIVVLVGVFAVLLMTLLKGKKKGIGTGTGPRSIKSITPQGQAEYPELVSYIRDAAAAGASKQDTKSKLIEAGWPNEAIDKSFKFVGM